MATMQKFENSKELPRTIVGPSTGALYYIDQLGRIVGITDVGDIAALRCAGWLVTA
jgi:hypothetical protein